MKDKIAPWAARSRGHYRRGLCIERARAELRRSLQVAGGAGGRGTDDRQGRRNARLQLRPDRRGDRKLGQRVVPREPAQGQQDRERERRRRDSRPSSPTAQARRSMRAGLPRRPRRTRRRPTATRSRRCSGTCGRSTRREAHAITGGSPAVLVGDIDTGLDYTHPDLARTSTSRTASTASSGAPVAGLAAQDDNGHGTHTAGTIAAASNGIGIVGVAPNVKIAGIKAGNADGLLLPGGGRLRVHVGGHARRRRHEQQLLRRPVAVQLPERPRAAGDLEGGAAGDQFAQQQGVTVVAAEGNQADDLAHPTQDATSPDDTTPGDRGRSQRLRRRPGRGPGRDRRHRDGNAQHGDRRAT